MSEYKIFIQGWNSCKEKIIQDIKLSTTGWQPNGPSVATVEFIIQQIQRLPTPVPEEAQDNAK